MEDGIGAGRIGGVPTWLLLMLPRICCCWKAVLRLGDRPRGGGAKPWTLRRRESAVPGDSGFGLSVTPPCGAKYEPGAAKWGCGWPGVPPVRGLR